MVLHVFNILIYAATGTGALLDLIPLMAATTPHKRRHVNLQLYFEC